MKKLIENIRNKLYGLMRKVQIELLLWRTDKQTKKVLYRPLLLNQLYCDRLDCYGESKNNLKAVKVILDNLLAPHIVGVQPMNGPVALNRFLRTVSTEQGLSLKILKNAIESQTVRLTEVEPLEIAHEINKELIGYFLKMSNTVTCPKNILLLNIDFQSNDIAIKTMRGGANWMLMDACDIDVISTQLKYHKNPIQIGKFCEIGTIGTKRVILSEEKICNGKIIIGFNGTSHLDSGLIFNPYIMLVNVGKSFATRRSYSVDDKAKEYYHVIEIGDDQ